VSTELKPMPLASVIYALTFDPQGKPTVQAKIYADTGGRLSFEGDAGKAYTMLCDALDTTTKRLATCITDQMTRGMEEKRLLQRELDEPANPPPTPLPATGEVF